MSLSISHVVRLNENLGPDNRLVARRFFLHLRDFFEALQRSVEHEPVVVARLTTQMNLLNGLARTTAQVGRTYTMPKLKMVGVSFHGCLGGDGKRRFLDHVAGICTRLNYCPVHRAVFVRTLGPSMWLVKQYEERIFWGLAFAFESTRKYPLYRN